MLLLFSWWVLKCPKYSMQMLKSQRTARCRPTAATRPRRWRRCIAPLSHWRIPSKESRQTLRYWGGRPVSVWLAAFWLRRALGGSLLLAN